MHTPSQLSFFPTRAFSLLFFSVSLSSSIYAVSCVRPGPSFTPSVVLVQAERRQQVPMNDPRWMREGADPCGSALIGFAPSLVMPLLLRSVLERAEMPLALLLDLP